MCISVSFGNLLAQNIATESNATDSSSLYPSAGTLFSPRIYGNTKTSNHVELGLTLGYLEDQALFVRIYPQLYQLLTEGKIKLEIKLWGHNAQGLPPYLVAQCMDPLSLPNYMYETFSKSEEESLTAETDLEEFYVQQALADPRLFPPGLNREQFHRRLEWCLNFRREGRIYNEASRFDAMYKSGAKNGGGVFFPIVVINQKIFEAIPMGDQEYGFDTQGVLDALKEISQ
jgi:hypothetical protein